MGEAHQAVVELEVQLPVLVQQQFQLLPVDGGVGEVAPEQGVGQVAEALTARAGDTAPLAADPAASAAAEGSLRLTRLSFAAGNSGVLQVLDAQRQVQQARLGLIRARAERCIDTAQLLLAMGGGPKKGFADLPE